MDKKKITRLQGKGWKVGNAADFLNLSPVDSKFIELKLSLSHYLQKKRVAKRLTQVQLARIIRSSQSRVAKMEKNDSSVSLDLMVRSLFALGVTKKELANAVN